MLIMVGDWLKIDIATHKDCKSGRLYLSGVLLPLMIIDFMATLPVSFCML